MRRPSSFLAAALLATAALPTSALAAGPPPAPTDPQLTIYAGNGTQGFPVPGPALASPRSNTAALDVTSDGTLYALDSANHVVEKITPDGELSIVAGNGTADPFTPGPATSSGLGGLTYALAAEDDGTLYIGDWISSQIAKITPDGQLSIFAGNGLGAFPVEGPALSSPLGRFVGLDTDADGNVYFGLQDRQVVMKVTPAGDMTRIAGSGDGGPFIEGDARWSDMVVRGGTVLPDGTYYIASGIPSIARVKDGTLKVIDTTVSTPVGLSHDGDGNVYAASNAGSRITKLGPDGSSPTPIAGDMTNGLFSFTPGDPLDSAWFSTVVATDESGVTYTVDYAKQIGRIGVAVPSRPRDVQVTDLGGAAEITFRPPVNRGLTPILGYDVSTDGGTSWAPLTTTPAAGGRLTGTVSGLSTGSHDVLVRARNTAGGGITPAAPQTVTVTPAAEPGSGTGGGTPAGTGTAPAAATPTPAAIPAATPAAAAPSCRSIRRVKLTWQVPAGARVRAVAITVDGKRVRTLRGAARSATVALSPRVPRRSTVRIVATTAAGKRLASTRVYRLCAPRAGKALATTALRPVR